MRFAGQTDIHYYFTYIDYFYTFDKFFVSGSSLNLLNQEKCKKAQTSVRIPTHEKHIWDRESTEHLIHLHKKLSPFVGTPTCVNEHKLWEKLSYELAFSGYTFTPEEVENKWKILVDTIKSKRKEIGNYNKK